MNEVLTVEEVAAKLRVSEPVVRKLLRQGRLKGCKVGKEWRILESTLEAYLRGDQGDNSTSA